MAVELVEGSFSLGASVFSGALSLESVKLQKLRWEALTRVRRAVSKSMPRSCWCSNESPRNRCVALKIESIPDSFKMRNLLNLFQK